MCRKSDNVHTLTQSSQNLDIVRGAICDECIKQWDTDDPIKLAQMIHDINETVGVDKEDQSIRQIECGTIPEVCPSCGTVFQQIADDGVTGCENCYREYACIIKNVLEITRMKKDDRESLAAAELQERLLHSLEEENYEMAAQIRDELLKLEAEDDQ